MAKWWIFSKTKDLKLIESKLSEEQRLGTKRQVIKI